MIPRKIHYCWFGKKPKSGLYRRCIESWKRLCPDYEIIEWNEVNFDLGRYPYLQWCYDRGKWAFISDFARLIILKEQGGIYLDTELMNRQSGEAHTQALIADINAILEQDPLESSNGRICFWKITEEEEP